MPCPALPLSISYKAVAAEVHTLQVQLLSDLDLTAYHAACWAGPRQLALTTSHAPGSLLALVALGAFHSLGAVPRCYAVIAKQCMQETSWTAPMEVKALLDKKPKVEPVHQSCNTLTIGILNRERLNWKTDVP